MKATHLHQLVHALSPAEKNAFRKSVPAGKDAPKYLELLDVLLQYRPDETDKLQKKLDKHFTKTSLPMLRQYLYEAIMKSLNERPSELNLTARINKQLSEIAILVNRNLREPALTGMEETLQLALDYEEFNAALSAIRLQKSLLFNMFYPEQAMPKLEEVLALQNDLLNKQMEFLQYDQLFRLQDQLLRKGISMHAEAEKQALAKLMNSPLLSDQAQPQTLRAKRLYHTIRSHWFSAIGNNQQSAAESFRLVEVVNTGNLFLNTEPITVIGSFNYALGGAYSIGNFEQMNVLLQKMEQLQFSKPLQQTALFQSYAKWKLHWARHACHNSALTEILADVSGKLLLHEELIRLDSRITITESLAMGYLTNGAPEQALDWINRMRNIPKTDLRNDTRISLELLRVVALIELGQSDVAAHCLQTLKRNLPKSPLQETSASKPWIKILEYWLKMITELRPYPKVLAFLQKNQQQQPPPIDSGKDFLDFLQLFLQRKIG